MPDKKLTDSEIKTALKGAILNAKGFDSKVWSIEVYKLENALNLINRLQEEKDVMQHYIDHLQKENERFKSIKNSYDFAEYRKQEIKAEAYKEFAEKTNSIIDSLIEKYSIKDFEEFKAICQVLRGLKNDTNNLLKELVGENNG